MQRTLVVLAIALLMACQKNDGNQQNMSFNRSDLLQQAADNIILPALKDAENSMFQLQEAIRVFINNPNEANLLATQASWKQAAKQWQSINIFNFGPAGEMGINKSLNEEAGTFPVNTVKIENYITAKDTSFNNFDRDARGLFAIEFLIFGLNQTPSQIIETYSSSSFRAAYLTACANKLAKQITLVNQSWKGNYSKEFKVNTGTDIGSSVSLYYNEFLKSYEGLKNFKFGIPLGLRPGQTSSAPEKVEAYYSGYSLDLAKAQWQQLKNIWEGRAFNGQDGVGFKEYLETISGGNALIESTQKQMAEIDKALSAVPEKPLSASIQDNFETVNAVHTELQKHTRFFKSDLSSLVGIAITYSSGDGD